MATDFIDSSRRLSRLWVVTELYYPEETSTGHHMTEIAEGLSPYFDVNVICGQPNYSARGTRAPKREVRKGVSIHRVPGTRLDKNVITYRVINMITLGISVLFKALRSLRRGDHVLVVTTPPNMPFACAFAALLRSAAYTLLIHDNYPQALIAAGKATDDSIIVRTWRIANRWLFKHASRIIVLGRDMKQVAERESAGLDVPVVQIPNWAELETVRPMPRENNRLLNELKMQQKFVFLYAGNMGYTNDLETLVQCANEMRDDSRIQFVFLGAGAKKLWLHKEVQLKQLPNVTIRDPRPRIEQQDFLNACDVAVITLVKGMFGVSVPSRIYNALAAGKPLLAITEEHSELAQIIDEDRVGWRVEPGDAISLQETIRRIMTSNDELASMGRRARVAAETKYSLERAISAYKSALANGNLRR